MRIDGCIYEGWIVPMEYDPLLAKLTVWAGTREHAVERLIRALREYDVGGHPHQHRLLPPDSGGPRVPRGAICTPASSRSSSSARPAREAPADFAAVAALVAALHTARRKPCQRRGARDSRRAAWLEAGRGELLR